MCTDNGDSWVLVRPSYDILHAPPLAGDVPAKAGGGPKAFLQEGNARDSGGYGLGASGGTFDVVKDTNGGPYAPWCLSNA